MINEEKIREYVENIRIEISRFEAGTTFSVKELNSVEGFLYFIKPIELEFDKQVRNGTITNVQPVEISPGESFKYVIL